MASLKPSDNLTSKIVPGFIDDQNIYLSVLWYSGCLGSAYYDGETAMLHFLLETMEMPPFNSMCNLIEELKPVAIITSAKQDTKFLNALQSFQLCQNSSTMSDYNSDNVSIENSNSESDLTRTNSFSLEMLSSAEFDYTRSKHRILSVDLPGIPEYYTHGERSMHLSSLVPFDSVSTIRAAGGLLRYLEKKHIGVSIPILGFHIFTSKNELFIDRTSYKALQIFRSVSHPSAYKVSTREGLSLFGVLNHTITRHGYKLLKSWFYHPTNNMKILKHRLDVISFFVNSRNEEVLTAIKSNLKHVKNVTKILAKVKTSKLNVTDWINILQTAQSALRIADVCNGVLKSHSKEEIPVIFKDVTKSCGSELNGIVSMITNHMDISASKQENRFVVLPGISEVIDQMKKTYSQLPALLDKVAQQEIETYIDYLSACQIVYMRRMGYLLFASKKSLTNINDESLTIPGMTFVAVTNETVFYKTCATQKLDDRYGDILENIAYHEMEVMSQLQNTLLEHASVFINVLKYTAELDCLLSFALVAKNYNYTRPCLVENNVIEIEESRHPLQEHVVSLFVPNNINFGQKSGLVSIVTGPNASGKSVYLKQVGLIVFMTHLGSFVPAESACIGKITAVYTIVRSPESLSSHLSTFASDLNRMATAVQKADEKSIILIDEFGKGTATVDGVSLLVSCLTYFIRKPKPPMVLCTTHFHSLTQHDLLPASETVKFYTLDTANSKYSNTACLFQLVEGFSKYSHASAVANDAGVPPEIIARGSEISKILKRNAPIHKFDKSSALSYQLNCNVVVENAVKLTLTNCDQLKLFFGDIAMMFSDNERKSSSGCISDT